MERDKKRETYGRLGGGDSDDEENEDLPVSDVIASSLSDSPLTPEEIAAYDAPFPDPSFKMGPRAMPSQAFWEDE